MIPERFRDAYFALLLVVALAAGAAFDALGTDVAAGRPGTPAAPRFVERTQFCPPGAGKSPVTHISALPESSRGLAVSVAPNHPDPSLVAPDHLLFGKTSEGTGADVVGYGGDVAAGVATAVTHPVRGAAAAPCTHVASTRWYFPAGSSELGADERILLYNPFPDEAVVALNFYTPTGPRSRTGLSDIAVPAGSFASVSVNDYIQVKSFLGVGAVAKRGRIVAWRELFDRRKDRPHGVQLSAGGYRASRQWYFPDGRLGTGAEETISVLNPSTTSEAVIDITLTTDEGLIQVPALMDKPVPPGSAVTFSVAKAAGARVHGGLAGVSAVVSSRNGVGVLAERTVWYSAGLTNGVASELGATTTARRWYAPPATWAPTTDAISVMNPTGEAATIDISLVRDGDPRVPNQLQDIKVPSGGRIGVPLGAYTRGRAIGVIVESSGGVVVERFSYSAREGDAAAVMGSPVTQ
jgi:hypothetical protein